MRAHIARKLFSAAAIMLTIMSVTVRASDNWPERNLAWPRQAMKCASCFHNMVYVSAGFQPYEKNHLFRVNWNGGYFFKQCSDLANFVNNGVINNNVYILPPFHVLIALEYITYTSGRAHDETYGDGFVMMAPDEDPVSYVESKKNHNKINRFSSNHHVALWKHNAKRRTYLNNHAKMPKYEGQLPLLCS